MSLLRFYRRPKVGLALSGGGARGLAHIGVLKVLQRENIPIDYLAGTSMGGLIAAGFAGGLTAEEMEKEALRMSRVRNLVALMDPTVSHLGLFAGRRVQDYLISKIGEKDFTELAIPLSLVAVDLQTGEEVILNSGSVAEAVRATISLPGVFEPYELGGCLVVDGGLLNNLPADVARTMGADILIAVDVSADMNDWASFLESPKQRLIFSPVRLTIEMLMRCLGIMTDYIRRQKLAAAHPEVLIQPEVERSIGLFGFTRAAECIAAGEKAANDALPAIQRLMKRRLWLH